VDISQSFGDCPCLEQPTVSQPEDDDLNFPDFELPGEHTAPQGDLAPTVDFGGPPAEAEPAEIVPGGQSPAEEPLGGLGELGTVPLEPAAEGELGTVPLEPAAEGELGAVPLEPAAEGEPTELPDFAGEGPGGEEKPSKKKKRKGRISKTGGSEYGEDEGESIWQRLAKASPYTMMLWISLLGLVVGTVFLYLELKTYKFDLKAREAKQRGGAVSATYSGPARTNAVA
jgi:hypothetical protein